MTLDSEKSIQSDQKTATSGKYLTFSLNLEEYAIPVLKVKEILGMMPINSVPLSPKDIVGVINLRDNVIPVLDLRSRFNMPPCEHTAKTCIIVVEAQKQNLPHCREIKNCSKEECPAYRNRDQRCWIMSGTFCRGEIQGTYHEKIEACRQCDYYISMNEKKAIFLMGIIVDEVQEVATFKDEEVEEAPTGISGDINTSYINGVAKQKERIKIILDIDRVLSS